MDQTLDSSRTIIVSLSIPKDSSNDTALEIIRCEPHSTFRNLREYLSIKYSNFNNPRYLFSVDRKVHKCIPLSEEAQTLITDYHRFFQGNHLQLFVEETDDSGDKNKNNTGVLSLRNNGMNLVSVFVEMNVLTVQKRLQFPTLTAMPISTTTFRNVLQNSIDMLNYFERTETNFCERDSHTIDDIVSVNFHNKTYTSDQIKHLRESYIKDILGYDVIPMHRSVVLMIYTNHLTKDDINRENALRNGDAVVAEKSVEFLSESELLSSKMYVTESTTINDIKEYICSVYAHSTRINVKDVKLILHGQILQDNNAAVFPLFLKKDADSLENISTVDESLKIHVVVNTDGFFRYDENEPGFWTELFHNPNRFSFMNRSRPQPENTTFVPPVSAHAVSTPDPSFNTNKDELIYEIYDSSNNHICTTSSTSTLLTSSLSDSSISQDQLNNMFEYYIQINGKDSVFPLNLNDNFQLHNNILLIDSNIQNDLNQFLEIDSRPSTGVSNTRVAVSRNDNNNNDSVDDIIMMHDTIVIIPDNAITSFIKKFITVMCRGIYLILRSSILGMIIILQVSTFLPLNYTLGLILLNLLRTIWVCQDFWDLITEFFIYQKISDFDYNNIYLRIIVPRHIDLELLLNLKKNDIVKRHLLLGLRRCIESTDHEDINASSLIPATDIQHDEELLGYFFQQLETQPSDVVSGSLEYTKILTPLINYFIKNINSWKISGFENTVHTQMAIRASEDGVAITEEGILKELSDLKNVINIIRNYYINKQPYRIMIQNFNNFFNDDLLRLLTPRQRRGPRAHDAGGSLLYRVVMSFVGVIVIAVQNIVLFVLILIPHFQRVFEQYIQQREEEEGVEQREEEERVEQVDEERVEQVDEELIVDNLVDVNEDQGLTTAM